MSEPPPVYILAGGRSSRFGSDKARAELNGRPLIVRQAEQIQTLGHRVIVVAREADQYADLGLNTIADLVPDQGPVGGLLTALRHRGEGWLVLTSCDLLTLKGPWLATLCAAASHPTTADAIAYRTDRWQPFPGLYHTRLLARPNAWNRGSLQHLLNEAQATPLPLPEDWPANVQANTPADLAKFRPEG